MTKAIYNLLTVLSVIFMLWILISWVDVLRHNDPITGDHEYSQYNIIRMMVNE